MPASAVNSRFGRMRLLWGEPARDEINRIEANRVFIRSDLTGDLAQDDVVAFERRDHERRPSLCLAEVREGEVEDYNITLLQIGPGRILLGREPILGQR
jgi:hypothetical protein